MKTENKDTKNDNHELNELLDCNAFIVHKLMWDHIVDLAENSRKIFKLLLNQHGVELDEDEEDLLLDHFVGTLVDINELPFARYIVDKDPLEWSKDELLAYLKGIKETE